MTALRRRLLLPVEGAQAAGQRRSARFQTGRSHRARAVWLAFSKRDWARPSATCFRCGGFRRAPALPSGPASPGFWRRSACFWFRAIRRWGIGCRSNRFRGPNRKTSSGLSIPTRFSNATSFRKGPRVSASVFTAQKAVGKRAPRPPRRRPPNRPRRANRLPWISRPALCVQVRDGQAVRLHAAGRVSRRLSRSGCRHRRYRRVYSKCRW